MTTKNLVLGILAFAFAIGSTFATVKTANPSSTAWVKVKFMGDNYFSCVNTGFRCSDFGSTTCTVYVETVMGPCIVPARRNMGCLSTLTENFTMPVGYFFPPQVILEAQ